MLGSRGFLPDDIREVIDLYLAGAVHVEHLTEHQRPLSEANEALEDLKSGRVLRTVLVPDKSRRWSPRRKDAAGHSSAATAGQVDLGQQGTAGRPARVVEGDRQAGPPRTVDRPGHLDDAQNPKRPYRRPVGAGGPARRLLDGRGQGRLRDLRRLERRVRGLAVERGVGQQELASETDRLARLLAFPDGGAYDPRPRWERLATKAGTFANLARAFELTPEEAPRRLDDLRETWRQLHDRGADMMAGLLTFVADRFGEAAIEDCYRFVLEPYLQERYKPFDIRDQPYEETIYRNLYLSFEAMRGHLCGPERTGDLEFDEHEDRWVIRFDPCGSGNRSLRGDTVEGTGSRAEPPYNFGVTKGRYDWAWNEEGICYYCAHCCFALERWPAEQWGHPLRVIDSPRYPARRRPSPKCSWTIYKSIEAIPEEAYLRIGMRKPTPEQSGPGQHDQ